MNTQRMYGCTHALAVALAVLLFGADATAQSSQAGSPPQLEVSADDPQRPSPRTSPVPTVATVEAPYWSSNGGYEFDSHDTGYGYFGPTYHRPIRDNLAIVAGVDVNYLHYQFPSSRGMTEVRAPGAGVDAGLRFGDRNWFQVKAGPSFDREHRQIRDEAGNILSSDKDIQMGLSLGADLWANPTSHSNIHGMLHYGTGSNYTWSRLGYKEQISNRSWRGRFSHYVGGEFIGQGNEDIRSFQVGPFVEFLHAPSSISIMLRGGYKQSSFDIGEDKTGPYFAVSFYQQYRRR